MPVHATYFELPIAEPDADEAAAFEELFAHAVTLTPGSIVEYSLPYLKFHFFDFLVTHKNLLLHGSPRDDLTMLDGVRRSSEADGGFGAQNGTYAASDGIWPIWFAILSRDAEWWKTRLWRPYLRNSRWKRLYFEVLAYAPRPLKSRKSVSRWTSNGVVNVPDKNGNTRRFARFSVSDWFLDVDGFGDGIVYALKRDGFEKDPTSEQWASRQPSPLLFGIPVTPADFPGMPHVRGHTADEFHEGARGSDLTVKLLKSVKDARHTDGVTEITAYTGEFSRQQVEQAVSYIRNQLPEECRVSLDDRDTDTATITIEGPEWVSALLRGFLSMRP